MLHRMQWYGGVLQLRSGSPSAVLHGSVLDLMCSAWPWCYWAAAYAAIGPAGRCCLPLSGFTDVNASLTCFAPLFNVLCYMQVRLHIGLQHENVIGLYAAWQEAGNVVMVQVRHDAVPVRHVVGCCLHKLRQAVFVLVACGICRLCRHATRTCCRHRTHGIPADMHCQA